MRTLIRVAAVAATLILATAPVVVAKPAPTDDSPTYKLAYLKQPNGMNSILIRWNPCRVHTYKVNLTAVPARTRSAVLAETHLAVRTMAAYTGIWFTYRGLTSEVPQVGSGPKQTADVIIAYTTPAKTNHSLYGPTISSGAPTDMGAWRKSSGTTYTNAVLKGSLVIDTPQMLRFLKPGFGAGMSRGNLLLHELGHVAGLNHVDNASQQMYGALTPRSPKGYAAGDLAGLAEVGRKAGCLNGF